MATFRSKSALLSQPCLSTHLFVFVAAPEQALGRQPRPCKFLRVGDCCSHIVFGAEDVCALASCVLKKVPRFHSHYSTSPEHLFPNMLGPVIVGMG